MLSSAAGTQLADSNCAMQDSSGLSRWRSIKVYKLDEVFQLVTDLQTRVDEEHDTEPERYSSPIPYTSHQHYHCSGTLQCTMQT